MIGATVGVEQWNKLKQSRFFGLLFSMGVKISVRVY